MKAKLDAEWVDMDLVQPNPWNPNEQSDFIFGKTIASILTMGFVDAIKVRETDAGYEVVDGEHRLRAAQLLYPMIVNDNGLDSIPWDEHQNEEYGLVLQEGSYQIDPKLAAGKVPIVNYGRIDESVAQELTIILNGTRGEPDPIRLAEVVKELDDKVGKLERLALLPFTEEDQMAMFELLDYDWQKHESPEPEPAHNATQGDPWVKYVMSVPPEKAKSIQSELDRIMGILQSNPELPDNIRMGLALEKMCVMSSQEPVQKLDSI